MSHTWQYFTVVVCQKAVSGDVSLFIVTELYWRLRKCIDGKGTVPIGHPTLIELMFTILGDGREENIWKVAKLTNIVEIEMLAQLFVIACVLDPPTKFRKPSQWVSIW